MATMDGEPSLKRELDDSGCVHDESPPAKRMAEADPAYSGQAQLLDLSDDVLLYILRYCSPIDLKALGYSCSRLGGLILDRSLWTVVDARSSLTGTQRLHWMLMNCLHEGTEELHLQGYATKHQGCMGHVNKCHMHHEAIAAAGAESDPESSDQAGPSRSETPYPLYRQHARMNIAAHQLPRFSGSPSWSLEDQRNDTLLHALSIRPGIPNKDKCLGPVFTLTQTLLQGLKEKCNRLTALTLHGCDIDCKATGLGLLPPTLKKLSLRGVKCFNLPMDKSFLFKIQDYLPELEELDVSECQWMEPSCLLPLSKMTKLQVLIMRDCHKMSEFVAYASLATRYGFKALRVIDLRGCPVGDSEVSALGWVTTLEELYLSPSTDPAWETHGHTKGVPLQPFDELTQWEAQEPSYFASHTLPEEDDRDDSETSEELHLQIQAMKATLLARSEGLSMRSRFNHINTPRNNTENERDGNTSKNNPEKETDGNTPINNTENETGGNTSKNNTEKETDGNTSKNNSVKETGGNNSKSNPEKEIDDSTPTTSRYGLRTRKTDAKNDGKADAKDEGNADKNTDTKADSDTPGPSKRKKPDTSCDNKAYVKVTRVIINLNDHNDNNDERNNNHQNNNDNESNTDDKCGVTNGSRVTRSSKGKAFSNNTLESSKKGKTSNQASNNQAGTSKNEAQTPDKKGKISNQAGTSKNETPDSNKNSAPLRKSLRKTKQNEISNNNDEHKKHPKTEWQALTEKIRKRKADSSSDEEVATKRPYLTRSAVNAGASTSKSVPNSNDVQKRGSVKSKNEKGGKKKESSDSNSSSSTDESSDDEPKNPPRSPPNPNGQFIRFRMQDGYYGCRLRDNYPPEVIRLPSPAREDLPQEDAHLEPRHHLLYVNVGERFHTVYRYVGDMPARHRHPLMPPDTRVDPRLLVTDAAIRGFGRSEVDDVNYVLIGPNGLRQANINNRFMGQGPGGIGPPVQRPPRVNLRLLSVTGYSNITDRSLTHLASAAPLLRTIRLTGTSVTEEGIRQFKALRPECELITSVIPKTEKKQE